ncbi:hypothetical protein M0811_13830 [Anaeramoeba ignava]|uniref:Uncharacterized protein n=1 Tax=Anaeramoeba ignava TaxID=1746090 RepID=A0A9Q0LXN0_ANAIG|nr:hypothetical protein M0811_13830 [Anaeramoeba ignava]|eukprot:Anaeramoba_ignava/a217274_251.p1 GENE.a217274_251~~a217274_251.p1  ORF type:complete len:839 (+),score=145.51 a217274_251:43-2559(+)
MTDQNILLGEENKYQGEETIEITDKDGIKDPEKPKALPICSKPLRVVGVQEKSPVSWSPDGNMFAFVSGNHSIYLIRKNERKSQQGTIALSFSVEATLEDHVSPVTSLLFHPNKPILVSGGHEGLFIWDLRNSTLKQKIKTGSHISAHDGAVECLIWLQNGDCLITGSSDTTLKAWDMRGDQAQCIDTINAHKAPILVFTYCPATQILASAGRDSTIKLWDISKLNHFFTADEHEKDDTSVKIVQNNSIEGHRGDITALTFTRDGSRIWSGARDNDIILWSTKSAKKVDSISGHKGDIKKLLLMKNETVLISASADKTIKVWELSSKGDKEEKTEKTETRGDGGLEDVLQTVDNEALRKILEDDISLTTLIKDQLEGGAHLLNELEAHEEGIASLEMSPTAPLGITSSMHNSIRIWSFVNPLKIGFVHEFIGQSKAITSIRLDERADDDDLNENNQDQNRETALRTIFSGSLDYTVHQYDVETVGRLMQINFRNSVQSLDVSPDKQFLVIGGSSYDLKGYALHPSYVKDNDATCVLQEVARFVGHSGKIKYIAISPDGNMMTSSSNDFKLLTWKLKKPYSPKRMTRGELLTQSDFDVNSFDFKPGVQHVLVPEKIKPTDTVHEHEGHVNCFGFNSNATLFASCGNDHKIVVYKPNTRKAGLSKKFAQSNAHNAVIECMCWCKDFQSNKELLCTGSWDKTAKIWRIDDNQKGMKCVRTITDHWGKIVGIGASGDNRFLLTCSVDFTVRCFSLTEPFDCVALYSIPQEAPFTCLAVGKDSFVTGSENGMLRVWPMFGGRFDNSFIQKIPLNEQIEYDRKLAAIQSERRRKAKKVDRTQVI